MKYFIIDSKNTKQTNAPYIYLNHEVEIGHIFESIGNHILEDGKYKVKEVKLINEYTAECICDKVE